MADVDLVVNTFERTYRTVLAPGFFAGLAEQSRFRFAGRVALVNNVDDLADALARADRLIAAGELTAAYVVAERLPAALAATGLAVADLGRAPHYTDCSLVAVTAPGSPWLVYWDADCALREPVDWITPSVALMERDRRVLVANPDMVYEPAPNASTLEVRDGFALGLGFSDQLYLARRADLARPIYGDRTVAALRFPLAHVAHVFEARVDSHMRRHGRLRATHLGSAYAHPPDTAGASYPAHGRRERLRRMAYQGTLLAVRSVPRRARPRSLRDL
jgi:predicted transcriptional regulator